ncbi:MAG: reverse transcriptase domain-containing protein [Tepidisphaerales bacterium]
MYDAGYRVLEQELTADADSILFHRRNSGSVVPQHERQVWEVLSCGGRRGLKDLGRRLLPRIADTRVLRAAWDWLARRRSSPGPDGVCFSDFDDSGAWFLCRFIAARIAGGSYWELDEKIVPIPKAGDPRRFRKIAVQNVADRVAGRACSLILGPVVEHLFSPFSFGYRPRVGRLEALGTVLALAQSRGHWTWISADIERAFDKIPICRLLDACRQLFPDDVLNLIEWLADKGQARGERQGSPASPMFFNIFADRYLDRPWTRRHPDLPLLRYADDLLVPCANRAQALQASEDLARLARSAGTPLKPLVDGGLVDLTAAGQKLVWLGFELSLERGEPAIRIAERAWQRLALRLAAAQAQPLSPLAARQIVKGWLQQLGPCLEFEETELVISRVLDVCQQQGFDEMPLFTELAGIWESEFKRWQRIREDQRQRLPQRLRLIRERYLPGRPLCEILGRYESPDQPPEDTSAAMNAAAAEMREQGCPSASVDGSVP